MRTKLSTDGRVILLVALRRKLGLAPGDFLELKEEPGRLVLIPSRKRPLKAKIVTDSITGLPVLTAGRDVPRLTSRQVRVLLGD